MTYTATTTAVLPFGRRFLAVAVLIWIASAGPGVLAAGLGRCATAHLPWPVVLPDGTNQPAGALTVCMDRKLTGVSGLHEVRVGGHPVGMYLSRIGSAEGQAGDSVVLVFERNLALEHRLIGYAQPEGGTLRTYALYHPKALRERGKSLCVADLDLTDDRSVQLAARAGVPRWQGK